MTHLIELPEKDITVDVIIIGGGSAGCVAAIKAKEADPRLRVLIMEKAGLSRSGAITMGMDALNVVAIPGVSSPEDYVESMTLACEGVLNTELCRIEAERSFDVLKELEEWGVRFPRDPSGQYMIHKVHSKGSFLVDMEAPDLKKILARQVKKRGVEVLERTVVTSLLAEGGVINGVVSFNIRSGEIITCAAKAVILTTGCVGRFGLPKSGYLYGTYEFPGNAGDGYSMAYRAGAEVTGLEYLQILPLIKDFNGPSLYVAQVRGARVVNALGERVGGGLGEREMVAMKAIYEETRADRSPIYLDMTHLSEERIREIEAVMFGSERPTRRNFFEGRGIDLRKQPVELQITEPYLCGGHGLSGVVINEQAETTLKGLYAAGDVSAVPWQYLTGAFVFGAIAGRNAARYASQRQRIPEVNKQAVQAERDRLLGYLSHDDGIKPQVFEYKLRRIVNDYIAPPKSEGKLKTALWWIERFKQDLPRVRSDDLHELMRTVELQCILDCAELSARASLERKESRWGLAHYRVDYPERDDNKWLRHIVLRRDVETGEMIVTTRRIAKYEVD